MPEKEGGPLFFFFFLHPMARTYVLARLECNLWAALLLLRTENGRTFTNSLPTRVEVKKEKLEEKKGVAVVR